MVACTSVAGLKVPPIQSFLEIPGKSEPWAILFILFLEGNVKVSL